MWCKPCQQDVPAASDEGGKLSCPRCRGLLGDTIEPAAATFTPTAEILGEPATSVAGNAPPAYDAWEIGEQLQHIRRLLDAVAPLTQSAPPSEPSLPAETAENFRMDAAHVSPTAWHVPQARKAARRRNRRPQPAEVDSGVGVWTALFLGVMLVACGGVLLGWSMATGRNELWTVGLPIALVGQMSLVVSLVLQLERLWRNHRRTAEKLDDVGEQIQDLKTSGDARGRRAVLHPPHPAVSPQLLLTDLKSQLDALTARLSQDKP